MEPNKVENQIREKLNSREIQPSAQAWDRLDAMLSVAEEKKTKRPFGFLFIAASILVFATLGMFFFNQNSIETKPQNDVVTNETKDTVKNEINKLQVPKVEKNKENQVVVSTEIQNLKSSNSNQGVSIINQKQSRNPIINQDKEIEYQINQEIAQKEIPQIVNQKTSLINNIESAKLDDFLLTSLNKKVTKTSEKQLSVKVDAKSLLSQVDNELELTFREKVIKKVSKNYQEIKVALANRNNE